MKVRILKAFIEYAWYAKTIGDTYEVETCPDDDRFYILPDKPDYWILVEDTELVTDVQPVVQPLGKKYDQGKPRYSLLPPNALEEVVKVLTFGSNKYEDFNWMNLDNPNDRFFSAASRHMWAWQKGEKLDSETGYNHLAAAITNLMFILELELLNADKSS